MRSGRMVPYWSSGKVRVWRKGRESWLPRQAVRVQKLPVGVLRGHQRIVSARALQSCHRRQSHLCN